MYNIPGSYILYDQGAMKHVLSVLWKKKKKKGKKKKSQTQPETNEGKKTLTRVYRSLASHPQKVTGAYDHEQMAFQALRLTCQLVPCNPNPTWPFEHSAVKVQIFWSDISRKAMQAT